MCNIFEGCANELELRMRGLETEIVKISQVIYLSNLNIYSNFNLFLFLS